MSSVQYSQRGQDLFAMEILQHKMNGTFLDFGCRGPTDINNTYLLESQYNFSGLSFDIDEHEINCWKISNRNYNNAICCNLLNTDFVLEKMDAFYKSNIIDYFSFDLEPPLITLEVLKNFPFDRYKFGVITFEHDFYRGFDTVGPSRKIFLDNGYRKINKTYMHKFDPNQLIHLAEDWWIHPDVVTVSEDLLDTTPEELDTNYIGRW